MKNLSHIVTGVALVLSSSAFAGKGEKLPEVFGGNAPERLNNNYSVTVTKEISKSFASKFSAAENISWRQREGFYFADFNINKKTMFAAYTPDGELLGATRILELSQLPLHVEMAIKENFVNHRKDRMVTEMVYDGETTYHLNAENKTHFLKLKCDSQGLVSVVQRTKKKLIGSVY